MSIQKAKVVPMNGYLLGNNLIATFRRKFYY